MPRTKISSTSSQEVRFVAIPGGPCFSSQTIAELGLLPGLALMDPAGVGQTQALESLTYLSLLEDMEHAIQAIGHPIVLIGHSFGGIQAAHIATRATVQIKGLVTLATPLSKAATEAMQSRYLKLRDAKMEIAEAAYTANPSNNTFLQQNLSYLPFYFSEKFQVSGAEMLMRDLTSEEMYRKIAADAPLDWLLAKLRALAIPKLSIAAECDAMFPVEVLREEADQGGMGFRVIPRAAHFVTHEAPRECAREILGFFDQSLNHSAL